MTFNPNGRDSRPVLHICKSYLAGMESDTEVIDLHMMAEAHNNPDHDLNRMIEKPCTVCGKVELVPAMTAAWGWACDPCREQVLREEQINYAKRHWDAICPAAFRDTDRNHAGFPKALLNELYAIWKTTLCATPIVIQGAPKSGKTRLALELGKAAMMMGKSVGVAWPEDLEVAQEKWERVELAKGFSKYDVLIIDEPVVAMLAGPKVAPFVKRILDLMARQGKTWVIATGYGLDGRTIGTQFIEQVDGVRQLATHWNNSKVVTLGSTSRQPTNKAKDQDEF
jgi:hypothetical protein